MEIVYQNFLILQEKNVIVNKKFEKFINHFVSKQ